MQRFFLAAAFALAVTAALGLLAFAPEATAHALNAFATPAALAMVAMPPSSEFARGIMNVRADSPDATKILSDLQAAWGEFKVENDKQIAALKKGQADVVQAEKVDKINATISDLQSQLGDLATKLAAAELGGGGAEAGDVKASKVFAAERGKPLTPAEYSAYRDGLNVYMRRGDATPRDVMAAMSVGSDPDGGYTVTPDTSGRIVKRIFETSPMRQMATVSTIGTDRIEGFNDLGEGSANWVSEGGPRPRTGNPQIGKWEIPVHELYAFPETTQRLLDDSAWNVEAWLAEKTADKFARVENAAFVNGDGIGKPKGLLAYPTAVTADATRAWGTFQHVLTGTDGGFGAAANGSDKLIDLVYSVKAPYRTGASFMMARSVVAAVRKLKDGQGNYLWQPNFGALGGGTLLGFGIAEAEDMPAMAADSLSIAFGNFGEAYLIVDRVGIRVLRDALTNKPYVGFYTTKRVGGGANDFEAVKFLKFGD